MPAEKYMITNSRARGESREASFCSTANSEPPPKTLGEGMIMAHGWTHHLRSQIVMTQREEVLGFDSLAATILQLGYCPRLSNHIFGVSQNRHSGAPKNQAEVGPL